MNTESQSISWPLSYLGDPFYSGPGSQSGDWRVSYPSDPFFADFMPWLESVVESGQGLLRIDIEGAFAEIHVTPSQGDNVKVRGISVYENQPDFNIDIPRHQFVSVFYSSLVAFWESDALKQKWHQWLLFLNDPEERTERGQEFWQPWPIRSDKVERYLGADTN